MDTSGASAEGGSLPCHDAAHRTVMSSGDFVGDWHEILCDFATEDAIRLARRQGVDAVLTMTISMLDLTSRLMAFSTRLDGTRAG